MIARTCAVAIAAVIVLSGCRDEERIRLKSENHKLRQELRLAKNRISVLEGELQSAQFLYAPPPRAQLDPSISATGGEGQRGPVTGPPVASALAQYRRPVPRPRGTRAVPVGAEPVPQPAAPTPSDPPRDLVPLSTEQLEALEQASGE